jgi:hypothetical protein
MDDPGPLRGPDITQHLQNPRSFGVTGAASPDGVQTIEFTTEPSVHGAHGSVRVSFADSEGPALTADISWGSRGRAACRSLDSIRIWGAFSPEADLVVRAPGQVRLVARSGAGVVLGGPATVSSELEPMSFAW